MCQLILTRSPLVQHISSRQKAHLGIDFSGTVCAGAAVDDLDETAIENFRANWIEKRGKKQLATLSKEQLLHDCGAITDDGVTYAALILFGKKTTLTKYLPQAEIVFEYRSSEVSGPANQREEFRIGFFACYDRIWELVNLRNDKQHYQEGFFVFDISTFNERVVREAILNAVSHRNYQLSGNVFVRQYRDRLVVESPGGFPLGISLDNILDRQAPRNRRIAEMLSLCGMVERSGQGMNLMYELSVQEAKPLPDFTGTDDYFVSVTLNGLIIDKAMLSVINRIGDERMESLSTNDFLAIDALYHQKPLTDKVRSRLKRLTDMGIVEHAGRNKYVLARSLYAATGQTGVHTRRVGLDRDTNKELLLKHIRSNGKSGTPLRLCSHKGIDNKGKIDKGKKDNIKLIIASENTTISFETAKKPLNLIALSVQLLIIVPRIFTVAFRRDYGYVTKFRRQRTRIVSFVCPVHQKIDWLVNRTKTSQQGAAFRSIAAVSRRQRKHYPIPIRCGNHMKLGFPSAACPPHRLGPTFFKAPIPSGCTLIQVESRLTTFT